VRMSISLIGFYLIARGGHWIHLLVCLVGFMTVRFVLTKPQKEQLSKTEEKDTK
jgi:hypothetical protein